VWSTTGASSLGQYFFNTVKITVPATFISDRDCRASAACTLSWMVLGARLGLRQRHRTDGRSDSDGDGSTAES
jgi:predicted permease